MCPIPAFATLNRTILELKHLPVTVFLSLVVPLNRTILELKLCSHIFDYWRYFTLNRTILELKQLKNVSFDAINCLEPYHFGIETL